MAVGPYQHEAALVERGNERLGDGGEADRHLALLRGFEQRCRFGDVGAKAEQGEAAAEQIEGRTAVGQEGVRRAMAGPRRRHIHSWIIGRRRATVGQADRRALIAIAEMDAEREPFAAHGLGDFAANFVAGRRTLWCIVEQIGMRIDRQHAAQIAGGLGDVAGADRLALGAVGIEQGVAAPALQCGSELPG